MHCRRLSEDELLVNSESCEETELLGFILGREVSPGLAVLLHGGLGMGKTALARGIGLALEIMKIKSPSFIIVAEHTGRIPLAHADLYRLENGKQVEELDLDAYLDEGFLLVVEWAERWETAPSSGKLDVTFALDGKNESRRNITIKATGTEARIILSCVSSELGGDGK